jgi:hypothetical protein
MAQRIGAARGGGRFGVVETVRGRARCRRRFRGNVVREFLFAIGTVALAPRASTAAWIACTTSALLGRQAHRDDHRTVILEAPAQGALRVGAACASRLLQALDVAIRAHQFLDMRCGAVAVGYLSPSWRQSVRRTDGCSSPSPWWKPSKRRAFPDLPDAARAQPSGCAARCWLAGPCAAGRGAELQGRTRACPAGQWRAAQPATHQAARSQRNGFCDTLSTLIRTHVDADSHRCGPTSRDTGHRVRARGPRRRACRARSADGVSTDRAR